MNGAKYILKKELDRVFKDKKLIFSIFFLPAILVVGIYAIMGQIVNNSEEDVKAHKSVIYIENAPNDFAVFMAENQSHFSINSDTADIKYNEVKDFSTAKEGLKQGDIDLIMEFPENFMKKVDSYTQDSELPQIKTYYNPSKEYSQVAREKMVNEVLQAFKNMLLLQRTGDLNYVTVFNVDTDNPNMAVFDEAKATGEMLGRLLPYLITVLLFAGAMNLCIDTFTGEKERGTMASMLISPIRREEIVIGKVLAIAIISIISSGIQLIAMIIGAPTMLESMGGSGELTLSFTPVQILQLAIIIFILTFLYVTLVSSIAIFARTVKEAGTYISPCYILIVVMGMMTMIPSGKSETIKYAIPFFNGPLAMQSIMANEISWGQFGLAVITSIAIIIVAIVVIAKAFNSEKIMFNA